MTATFDESRVDVSRAEDEANGRSSADGKGQQVRLRIDDRGMKTQYANAFRSNATHDELMLDFGINTAAAGGSDRQPREVRFDVHSRIIMNYATAKRLAILLGNVIREHESRYGEVRLSHAADRATTQNIAAE